MLSCYDVVIFLVDRNAPVNSSVAFVLPGVVVPPKAKDADEGAEFAPPKLNLAVAHEEVVVQADPSYNSVFE